MTPLSWGIDISHWQRGIDLSRAKAEGASFVIIKGGGDEGSNYVDPDFATFYKQAKEIGLPIGVYWFSNALTTLQAQNEARYFLEHVLKGRQFEFPVYMDVETNGMLSLKKNKLTDVVNTFCEYLEKRGYWVGIYSTPYVFTHNMNDAKLSRYAHWCAQWSTSCSYTNAACLGMWQYGGGLTNKIRSGYVAGYQCDQNYLYVDYPTLIRKNGLNGFEKYEKKSNEVIADEVIRGLWGVGEDRKARIASYGYDYSAIQKIVNEKLR